MYCVFPQLAIRLLKSSTYMLLNQIFNYVVCINFRLSLTVRNLQNYDSAFALWSANGDVNRQNSSEK